MLSQYWSKFQVMMWRLNGIPSYFCLHKYNYSLPLTADNTPFITNIIDNISLFNDLSFNVGAEIVALVIVAI